MTKPDKKKAGMMVSKSTIPSKEIKNLKRACPAVTSG